MEVKITLRMVQYLLNHGFASKIALALQLKIPYRILLKACGPNADRQTATRVAQYIVRGCIAQHIPIECAI